jgi:hypothetical protein
MRKIVSCGCLATLGLFATTARGGKGDDLLAESDRKLIPEICSYAMEISTTAKDGEAKTNTFVGYKRGPQRNVLIVKSPAKVAGSVHLRKDDIIWTYFTTNHRMNKVAYQAIFMGTLLSYGDVLATELSTDYSVTGVEEKGDDYVLTLAPRPGHEGYGKILVTIGKKDLFPKRRSYYSLSNVLLKDCEFTTIDVQGGALKTLKMEFNEPLKERKTTVIINDIKVLSSIPDRYYNENQLSYLGGE